MGFQHNRFAPDELSLAVPVELVAEHFVLKKRLTRFLGLVGAFLNLKMGLLSRIYMTKRFRKQREKSALFCAAEV